VVSGVVAARRAGSRPRATRGRRIALVTGAVAGIVLLAMTVVFNNVIVTLQIVAYDPARILGVRVGAFPIEDLAYAVGAAFLLPALWVLFDRTGGRDATRPARTGHRTQPRPEPEDPR
jgi:lycopene cyclase domain-containing protein